MKAKFGPRQSIRLDRLGQQLSEYVDLFRHDVANNDTQRAGICLANMKQIVSEMDKIKPRDLGSIDLELQPGKMPSDDEGRIQHSAK